MKRYSNRSNFSTLSEINVTPLLDLAFVLLIIFMITTPLLENSMNLVIPSSSAANAPISKAQVQTISIDRDETIRINNEIVEADSLAARLLELKRANPDVAIVIRPDRELPVQKLVTLMDSLQRAHITKVGIATNLMLQGKHADGAEIAGLDELLTELERNPRRELILDTTGSVIYTGNNVLMRLRRQMTIVYLAASAQEQELLIERYLNDPKPVLWRGAFQPKNGETPHETVARCYPKLVAARRQSYEALAHCTLPVADLHALSECSEDPSGSAKAFLEMIRAQLEKKSGRASAL